MCNSIDCVLFPFGAVIKKVALIAVEAGETGVKQTPSTLNRLFLSFNIDRNRTQLVTNGMVTHSITADRIVTTDFSTRRIA